MPVEAFAKVLYKWDLTPFNPREIPESEALVHQQEQSLSAVESALYECLTRGAVIKSCVFCNAVDFGQPLPRSKLFDAWSEEFGRTYGWPTKPCKFWSELKRLLGKRLTHTRPTIDATRTRMIQFADLKTCRTHWDQTQWVVEWQ